MTDRTLTVTIAVTTWNGANVDEPDSSAVHGLANHLGALLLGLDVLQSEEDLPDHAYVTVRGLLDEAHAAATLVRALQARGATGDGGGATHP